MRRTVLQLATSYKLILVAHCSLFMYVAVHVVTLFTVHVVKIFAVHVANYWYCLGRWLETIIVRTSMTSAGNFL